MGVSPSEYKRNCRNEETVGVNIPGIHHADISDELLLAESLCEDPCLEVCSAVFEHEGVKVVEIEEAEQDEYDGCHWGSPINLSGNS